MKTLRYRIGDQVKPGILDQNEKIRDASSIVPDWDDQNVTVEKLDEVKQIDKIWNSLTTKIGKPTGRINKDTILLRRELWKN